MYLTGNAMARKLANLMAGGEPTIHNEAEEKEALCSLWRRLSLNSAYPIVGYNVLAFDLPRLLCGR